MTRLSGIRAISFDVDGTLWDFDGTARFALSQVLAELARHDAEAARILDVTTFMEIRDRVHEELRGKITDLNEIRRESFKRVLRDIDRADDSLATRLTDVYFKHRTAGRVLFDDVAPAVEELGRAYTLGLVSNGNSYAEDFGLERWMSFQIFAQDHGGIEKPDIRLFQIALGEAGCAADELVHVGDSLENDVEGAAAAGIKSVWLNRNGDPREREIKPDAEIGSLRELSDVL